MVGKPDELRPGSCRFSGARPPRAARLRLPGGPGRHGHARCRRTPSSGGDRTRSCSRASWAATSGRPTASSACGRARWCARAGRRSRCWRPTDGELPRRRADERRASRCASSTTTSPSSPPAVPPGLPRFFGGAVGWLGYDIVRSFERLPSTKPDDLGPARALLRDHRHGRHLRQPARHREGGGGGRRRRRRATSIPAAPTTTPARASRRSSTA